MLNDISADEYSTAFGDFDIDVLPEPDQQPVTEKHQSSITGTSEQYRAWAMSQPMLTAEEELILVAQAKSEDSLVRDEAIERLVTSHLKSVVAIAYKYRGYKLPTEDLMQEGTIGLLKAIQKFDPSFGPRLGSYSVVWIKNEIHDYIMRNWKLVRTITTKSKRKLFFNLRTWRSQFQVRTGNFNTWMSDDAVQQLAQHLNVPVTDVRHMEQQFNGVGDVTDPISEGGDHEFSEDTYDRIVDLSTMPESVLETTQQLYIESEALPAAIQQLPEREREIILGRFCFGVGESAKTFEQLGTQYNISFQRVQQLEKQALARLKTLLTKQLEDVRTV